MTVIIKLNGMLIGKTTMTIEEIRKAEHEGFTVILDKKGVKSYEKL